MNSVIARSWVRALNTATKVVNRSPRLARMVRKRGHEGRVAFYGQFVRPGDLVFDVGAHIGNRTAAFVELGARVVSVEPQATCVAELRKEFGSNAQVTIVPAGLAAEPGSQKMYTSSVSTLSSMSPEFIESLKSSGRFAEFSWQEGDEVQTTTLDVLVAEHGTPVFCKIDVEGFEEQVLAGLSTPIPMVSLEFVSERYEATARVIDQLERLGGYEYNLVVGEENTFKLPTWASAEELLATLGSMRDAMLFGDIYARQAGA